MDTITVLALTFAIGVIAGLRSLTAPMVVSWAARLGWINLQDSWLAFMGYAATPYIFTVLALAELVNDKLPNTPSRKIPAQVGARILMGAVSGAALGLAGHQSLAVGGVLGGLGALAGTWGGSEFRTRLRTALKSPDWVVALIEDAIAVGGGFFLVTRY